MNDPLTRERRDSLIELFTEIAMENYLTNEDSLMIIEILQRAAERKRAEISEDFMLNAINQEEEQ